jgi:hypothetical protein
MAERDVELLDRLRAVNPVPAGRTDDLAGSEAAVALFERIVADDRTAGRRTVRGPRALPVRAPDGWRRPRTGRLAVVAAAATVSAGVAGYALVGRQPGAEVVACFAVADFRGDAAVIDLEGEDPVATCSDVWRRGAFGFRSAPALRGCVLESGGVGVFPEVLGGDVCRELGLAALVASVPETALDEADRFVAFRAAAQARFVGQDCVGSAPATTFVREELDRAGLRGWSVTTATVGDASGFSPERPCATLAFFPEQRTVTLVPSPPTG